MKKCVKCKNEKRESDFYENLRASSGLHSYCKKCVTDVNASWKRKNPLKARSYAIKARYGISEDKVRDLLARQNFKCAICMVKIDFRFSGHIDHDHKSGEVRGILCGSCNRAIGLLKDDHVVIAEAAAYIENYRERNGKLGAA